MVNQRIHKGTRIITVARMYHQTRLLDHHHYILILMYDLQGYILRDQLYNPRWIWQYKCDGIPCPNFVIGLNRFFIGANTAGNSRILDFIPRGIWQTIHKKLINAQWLLTRVNLKTIMLKQIILSLLQRTIFRLIRHGSR